MSVFAKILLVSQQSIAPGEMSQRGFSTEEKGINQNSTYSYVSQSGLKF